MSEHSLGHHKPSRAQKMGLRDHPKYNPFDPPLKGPEAWGPEADLFPKAVMGFAEERAQLDKAGNLSFADLVLKQGDLTYRVNQRVLTVETLEHSNTGPRQWKPNKRGTLLELHTIGRRRRQEHKVEKLVSVIDVDVFGPNDTLLSKTSYNGAGEFMDFLRTHGPDEKLEGQGGVETRVGRETVDRGLNYLRPKHVIPEAGNTVLPRGPLEIVGWDETKGTPVGELDPSRRYNLKIPVKKEGDVLEQVFAFREQLYLPGGSITGFTFMKGDRTFQVSADEMLNTPDPPGLKATRTFTITEYGNRARTKEVRRKQRKYTFEQLQKLLNERDPENPVNRLYTDFHFEIAKDSLDVLKARKVGRVAMRRVDVGSNPTDGKPVGPANRESAFSLEEDKGSIGLSFDEACEVLSSPDVYSEPEVIARAAELKNSIAEDSAKRSMLEALQVAIGDPGTDAATKEKAAAKAAELKKSLDDNEVKRGIVEALRLTIRNYGTDAVVKLAERLKDDYADTAKKLGMPVDTRDGNRGEPSWASLSGPLWAIAEERYWADHPNEAVPDRRTDRLGALVGNPLSGAVSILSWGRRERKIREMVRNQLGLAYKDRAVELRLDREPQDLYADKDGIALVESKVKATYVIKQEFVSRLQAFVQQDVRQTLQQIATFKNAHPDEEPPRALTARLGQQLERQFP